jgi:hypothetical protein
MNLRKEIELALAELDRLVAAGGGTEHRPMENVGDAGRCTDTAQWLRRALGGTVMGYEHKNNKEAAIGEDQFGHDFLVVRNFIVDWWAKEYLGLPAIYDLSDKREAEEALKNYGPAIRWSDVKDWPADWYKI